MLLLTIFFKISTDLIMKIVKQNQQHLKRKNFMNTFFVIQNEENHTRVIIKFLFKEGSKIYYQYKSQIPMKHLIKKQKHRIPNKTITKIPSPRTKVLKY